MVRKSKAAAKPAVSSPLDAIEEAVVKLREQGKNDPENTDYVPKLREILDQISDIKGEPRRPITAMPSPKTKKKRNVVDDDNDSDDEDEDDDEDEEMKEIVNKRLTTCMLLALSLSDSREESKDFYRKMKKRGDLEEVLAPFTKEEMKKMNVLLKSTADAARKRVSDAR